MADTETDVLKTPLHSLHLELGARMTPFAGYDMPLQYPLGIMKEHLHTRDQAGLFDVSHMGQVVLRPKSGDVADAALALERLVPVNILDLGEGRQRYALFTNDQGGIEDDLMVANRGDHLFVVVNAACKDADFARMQAHLSDACDVSRLEERALLALQGPQAEAALASLAPDCAQMKFMDVRALTIAGAECIVSRSGYSGEDGYEISVRDDQAEELARALLDHEAVEPIGLGARDSLRLEAGLCLYGSDLDPSTSPVEASLIWAMQKARRAGGAREGGFPGAARILGEMSDGPSRKRVGFLPEGRAPVRGGSEIFATGEGGESIGVVTSGAFGPSLGGPMAMGYVSTEHAETGTNLFAEVRGKRLPVKVADMPFVTPNYKRG